MELDISEKALTLLREKHNKMVKQNKKNDLVIVIYRYFTRS
jgi:hypothetical protein